VSYGFVLMRVGDSLLAVDVEALYAKYGPMVIRRCRRLLGDDQQAEDAAQDVFVRLVRYQNRLTEEAPANLLMKMATNICLNLIRRQASRPEAPDSELIQRIADLSDSEGTLIARLRLDSIFRNELVSTRTMALMHYVEGMTLEQVARAHNMSVSGVRKRLRSLRRRALSLEGSGDV
jgi:RNA polymerase sigma-70 factor (ECF subfamily)